MHGTMIVAYVFTGYECLECKVQQVFQHVELCEECYQEIYSHRVLWRSHSCDLSLSLPWWYRDLGMQSESVEAIQIPVRFFDIWDP